jgi:hypothetical protein
MPAVGRCLKRGTRLNRNKFPEKVGAAENPLPLVGLVGMKGRGEALFSC